MIRSVYSCVSEERAASIFTSEGVFFYNPAAVYVSPCSLLDARFSICATHYVFLLVSTVLCSTGFSAFSLSTYTVREGVDWIYLGRGRDCWQGVVDAVMNLRVS